MHTFVGPSRSCRRWRDSGEKSESDDEGGLSHPPDLQPGVKIFRDRARERFCHFSFVIFLKTVATVANGRCNGRRASPFPFLKTPRNGGGPRKENTVISRGVPPQAGPKMRRGVFRPSPGGLSRVFAGRGQGPSSNVMGSSMEIQSFWDHLMFAPTVWFI